jgi:hypothetical protein
VIWFPNHLEEANFNATESNFTFDGILPAIGWPAAGAIVGVIGCELGVQPDATPAHVSGEEHGARIKAVTRKDSGGPVHHCEKVSTDYAEAVKKLNRYANAVIGGDFPRTCQRNRRSSAGHGEIAPPLWARLS